jgi:hypothetical protein
MDGYPECTRTQAEQDAWYERFRRAIEKRVAEKDRVCSRHVIEGGCIVLQPNAFKKGRPATGL